MHDIEAKMMEISEMKDTICGWAKAEVAKGATCADTKDLGDAIDMIKDLAEAECKCLEACYYRTVIEAMEDAGDEYEEGRAGYSPRMGYNSRRIANGQYASKGRGRRGYKPYVDQEPYVDDYLEDMRYGYNGGSGRSGRSQSMSGGRNGYSPMYYTENEDWDRKKTEEHVSNSLMTMREIWKDADPELRKRMRSDLDGLIKEMS